MAAGGACSRSDRGIALETQTDCGRTEEEVVRTGGALSKILGGAVSHLPVAKIVAAHSWSEPAARWM